MLSQNLSFCKVCQFLHSAFSCFSCLNFLLFCFFALTAPDADALLNATQGEPRLKVFVGGLRADLTQGLSSVRCENSLDHDCLFAV